VNSILVTNILLLILIVISAGRWIVQASINHKMGVIKGLLASLVEVEMPALTAAISGIEGFSDETPKTPVIWPNRNRRGMNLRQ